MPTTTSTTTVHCNELYAPAELDEEALALAQRVTHKIRTPLPVAAQTVEDGEYEPQSWNPRPARSQRPSDL